MIKKIQHVLICFRSTIVFLRQHREDTHPLDPTLATQHRILDTSHNSHLKGTRFVVKAILVGIESWVIINFDKIIFSQNFWLNRIVLLLEDGIHIMGSFKLKLLIKTR